MLNSKKAEMMEYTIGLMVKMIFTVTVIVVTWMLVAQGLKAQGLNKNLDADVIGPLVMYNDQIMVVDESTNKVYPGWVDTSKINKKGFVADFDNSMQTYNDIDYLSMNITLSKNNNVIDSFYYREDEYKDNNIMVKGKLTKGEGG